MAADAEKKASEDKSYMHLQAFTNHLFDAFYTIHTKGELPEKGARVLVLPHQSSLDGLSLIRAIDEPISFIYSQSNFLKAPFLKAAQAIGGIKVSKGYVHVKRFFSRLDNGRLVAIFPQGLFEGKQVSSYMCGLDKLVSIYQRKRERQVTVIPTGIKYEKPSAMMPAYTPLPVFKFPLPGTKVILEFGQPRTIDTAKAGNLTETLMLEAAKLSGLCYNGLPMHRKRA